MLRLFRTALCGLIAVLTATFAAMALLAPANAAEKLRVGKAVPFAWTFTPLDVGMQTGIFAKHGLEIEASAFGGDARMQQALTADSIDVGIGSGPGMAFMAKGVPAKAVAVMAGVPRNMAVMADYNKPIRTVDDLRGKKLGVTTVGSLTDWLVRELSRQQGWGSDGIKIVPLGAIQARLAAMERGELDGTVQEAANGYQLEAEGKTRNLLLFGSIVKDFYTHVIFASDDMIANRPQLLRRFLRGWFATVAFMRANKDFTVRSEAKTLDISPGVVAKVYDAQMPGFSADGAWDPKAIEVIRQSLKELGILPTVPDAKALYNDQFVPVKFQP